MRQYPLSVDPQSVDRWFYWPLTSQPSIQRRHLTMVFPLLLPLMDVAPSDRATIRSVIEQQLQAFQQNDADAAFSFASPEIRAKFGTAELFSEMVKTAYPAVFSPRSVLFRRFVSVRGIPTQEVMLLAPDGNLAKALYLMEQQPDKSWKIQGCFLMPVQEEPT